MHVLNRDFIGKAKSVKQDESGNITLTFDGFEVRYSYRASSPSMVKYSIDVSENGGRFTCYQSGRVHDEFMTFWMALADEEFKRRCSSQEITRENFCEFLNGLDSVV